MGPGAISGQACTPSPGLNNIIGSSGLGPCSLLLLTFQTDSSGQRGTSLTCWSCSHDKQAGVEHQSSACPPTAPSCGSSRREIIGLIISHYHVLTTNDKKKLRKFNDQITPEQHNDIDFHVSPASPVAGTRMLLWNTESNIIRPVPRQQIER